MKTNFLIEVPHENSSYECYRAMKVFLESGSHFLAHAEWGCPDDDHRAVMIVEVENKEQALQIVPSMYRNVAKITEMVYFSPEDLGSIKAKLNAVGEEFHKHDS
jgi:hypothetical protein